MVLTCAELARAVLDGLAVDAPPAATVVLDPTCPVVAADGRS